MNMQELYEMMKEAAVFLGPGFQGMNAIGVKFVRDDERGGTEVRFNHSDNHVSLFFKETT